MQEYSYTETTEYTPNDVYGFDWKKTIESYDVVDFRPVDNGDIFDLFFLSCNRVIYPCFKADKVDYPRLILRKKKYRRFVFEECSKDEARIYGGYWVRDNHKQIVLTTYIDADTVFVRQVGDEG